jgi:hypothetical protein
MQYLQSGTVVMLLLTVGAGVWGQQALSPEQRADTERLRALADQTSVLPFDRVVVTVTPATPLWSVTAVTADAQGRLHVLHRPASADSEEQKQADPVLVLGREGRVLRTMGKGLFGIPHGIRVDAAGNIWTIDANRSMVIKFSPAGEKLMEVSVGDIPDPQRPLCGATDVAFAENGRFFVSDGYCNSRVIEFEAKGKKVREFGRRGTGPGEFMVVHGIAIAPDGRRCSAWRSTPRARCTSAPSRVASPSAPMRTSSSSIPSAGRFWERSRHRRIS